LCTYSANDLALKVMLGDVTITQISDVFLTLTTGLPMEPSLMVYLVNETGDVVSDDVHRTICRLVVADEALAAAVTLRGGWVGVGGYE
jgi:hypothetical protein